MIVIDRLKGFVLYFTKHQFIKFGMVGVLNTLITLAAIFISRHALGLNYIAANVLGYALGFINSYVLNKIWTFKSTRAVRLETIMFLTVTGVCYLLQVGFLALMKEKLGVDENYAQLIAMVFYTITNYFGQKYLTFKK